jgi:hypothetical protein
LWQGAFPSSADQQRGTQAGDPIHRRSLYVRVEHPTPEREAEIIASRTPQANVNAPKWTKWEDQQIETSIGDIGQVNNQTIISYSILNSSKQPVEIVPPQIQITGRKATKKKKKERKGIISDQLEIRDYRLSSTRLEPGERADGVVVFDRSNFKESTEKAVFCNWLRPTRLIVRS